MCCESTQKTKSTTFWENVVTTCGKPHTLLSETAVTTYENHPLPIKCDVTTHGKQHPLFLEREQWQLVENHIYCLVKQQ